MSGIRILFGFMLVLLLTYCTPQGTPNLLPELATCDSAVIMYYNTPGNPRFFKMVKVYDKASLSSLAEAANQPAHIAERDCNTQGKIYYYGDNGEVFVLYFTYDAACKSLTFIKTGEKYEVILPVAEHNMLEKLKENAYEPGNR
jgi:hypothetical protein